MQSFRSKAAWAASPIPHMQVLFKDLQRRPTLCRHCFNLVQSSTGWPPEPFSAPEAASLKMKSVGWMVLNHWLLHTALKLFGNSTSITWSLWTKDKTKDSALLGVSPGRDLSGLLQPLQTKSHLFLPLPENPPPNLNKFPSTSSPNPHT